MAVDHVEGLILEGQRENTGLVNAVVGQITQPEAQPHPLDRLGRQVDARPDRAASDQLLGVGALTQTDLQDPLAGYIQRVQAGRYVVLEAVAEGVVALEESVNRLGVVTAGRAPDEQFPTRMGIPE